MTDAEIKRYIDQQIAKLKKEFFAVLKEMRPKQSHSR